MELGNRIRILIIDDEPQMRRMLKIALTAHGYETREIACGQSGLEYLAVFKPDLIILGLPIPDLDGVEAVKQLRTWSRVPVVILSESDSDDYEVAALDAGADDYMAKPFLMGELLARIRNALRHIAGPQNALVLNLGGLIIDFSHRQVTVEGRDVKLTPTEYELLKTLAANFGYVLTYKQLTMAVWGPLKYDKTSLLRFYIRQLRSKIEAEPSLPKRITTEARVGYRLR
jgi:two-component system KDP operon response regulator KdpE